MLLLLVACGEVAPPVEEGVEREEIGTFTTDAEGRFSFPVTPPDDAVSMLVHCGPYGYEVRATMAAIAGPTGALYDAATPDATALRVGSYRDVLPVLLPVSPELDLAPGTYTFTVAFDAAEPVSATCGAVYRVAAVQPEPRIDLDLVFVGVDGVAPGLTAAEGEETLANVLDQVAAAWGQAGLAVGEIRAVDFEGDVDTYAVVDGEEELGFLLRTVEGDRRALPVFLVEELRADDGSALGGRIDAAPGLAAVGGTSRSGVVVPLAAFPTDPSGVARTLAHEGAHFLGLFHTTEGDGSLHDPLADTPACPGSADADADGELSAEECAGAGAENLMFWDSAGMEATADQGWVLARSPAVR